jgi:hypothetical protein
MAGGYGAALGRRSPLRAVQRWRRRFPSRRPLNRSLSLALFDPPFDGRLIETPIGANLKTGNRVFFHHSINRRDVHVEKPSDIVQGQNSSCHMVLNFRSLGHTYSYIKL